MANVTGIAGKRPAEADVAGVKEVTGMQRKVWPKIGLMYTGLKAYWPQYPELEGIGNGMYEKYIARFREIGEVVEAKFVNTPEKSEEAGRQGPIHHGSLGIGDISREIEAFAEAMGFGCVRV